MEETKITASETLAKSIEILKAEFNDNLAKIKELGEQIKDLKKQNREKKTQIGQVERIIQK